MDGLNGDTGPTGQAGETGDSYWQLSTSTILPNAIENSEGYAIVIEDQQIGGIQTVLIMNGQSSNSILSNGGVGGTDSSGNPILDASGNVISPGYFNLLNLGNGQFALSSGGNININSGGNVNNQPGNISITANGTGTYASNFINSGTFGLTLDAGDGAIGIAGAGITGGYLFQDPTSMTITTQTSVQYWAQNPSTFELTYTTGGISVTDITATTITDIAGSTGKPGQILTMGTNGIVWADK